jgi:endonuclease G, mitochondrial
MMLSPLKRTKCDRPITREAVTTGDTLHENADRTRNEADNSSTFLMTNMMPQVPEVNRGVWGDLEDYCRKLVQRRARNFTSPAGPVGRKGSIGRKEKIAVPAKNWKVIVVLDRQGLGMQGVTASTLSDRRNDA